MPRFFVESENISLGTARITGPDRDHIVKTLRMRQGEAIELCDSDGLLYRGVIDTLDADAVYVCCGDGVRCDSEPTASVTVFVAVPKGDKAELIVQKCVELGASRIVLFSSSRCVSRPDDKATAKKVERLQKIALEAAKQSERGLIPTVEGIVSYKEMLKDAASHATALFFYERGGAPIKTILTDSDCTSVALVSGPEGGFAPEEVEEAQNAGLRITSLGKRILRCETAPICALTAVMYHTDNF